MSGGIYNNGYRNPVAEYVVGYKKQFASTVNANIRLDQDLKMPLEYASIAISTKGTMIQTNGYYRKKDGRGYPPV